MRVRSVNFNTVLFKIYIYGSKKIQWALVCFIRQGTSNHQDDFVKVEWLAIKFSS